MTDRGEAPPAASGIVLAGGRSSRFGSDKLAAPLADGRALLDAAVAGVGAIATDVVVVLAPGDERTMAGAGAGGTAVRIARDAERFGGPLVGLLAGLEVVDEPLALVAGGDMPRLRVDVLALMIRTLATADAAFGAVVLERRGRLEPLPAALRVGLATAVARGLVADGERSLRSLFERLPTRAIDEAAWRPLDPDGATLLDVDEAADLDRRPGVEVGDGRFAGKRRSRPPVAGGGGG
jgi:molybdopterin-guanine dinucleotide biosynthesis protein A